MKQSYVWTVVAVVLVLSAVFYYYYGRPQKIETAEEAISGLTGALEEVGASKQVEIVTNPVGETTNINPIEKANPFTKAYQNPFK